MPVSAKPLLTDCQKQVRLLEADLKAQASALPELAARLQAEYTAAREAGRVGDAFEIWRGEQATQAAVHWVLGGVFVRFLEDNALIAEPLLAGAGDQGRLAEAAEQAFYREHPTLHERDWMLAVFRRVAALPGGDMLFDEAHNPAFRWPLSPDAAKVLMQFWRRPDTATGGLVHDFTDPACDTRFLGDLYQDLSEATRKKYALLQTPVFVEEFILDRTLGEALKELPLSKVTLIDPTCGSGHFLLGAFARLLAAWEVKEPGVLREELAQRALDQVAGVDLNPFAVAIARFRLMIAALRACDVKRLERAPAFRLHVAVGDALLHGDEPGMLAFGSDGGRGRYVRHAFGDEDLAEVNAVLGRRYAVVVGNPPYITPKDAALRIAYKQRYKTCHMQYALSVPFIERFWELAAADAAGGVAGWVGQITSNSFMKREFGKKLIEQFFPHVDLTHLVDTAGAYIPGHGTPTVILFGRARSASSNVVRAAMGIRGEPGTPDDPSRGEVWTSMLRQIDEAGSESAYMSVFDLPRENLATHPWSLGSNIALLVQARVEQRAIGPLSTVIREMGRVTHTGADEIYIGSAKTWERLGIDPRQYQPLVDGYAVRSWSILERDSVLFPYDETLVVLPDTSSPSFFRFLWRYKQPLGARREPGGTHEEIGLTWYEWSRFQRARYRTKLGICFADVATHNEFSLDTTGRVFSRPAPVIKLPIGSDEATHLGLLGLLNSSTACFWLKQVAHNKGSTVDQAGARQRTSPFEDFYQFNGTKVGAFPVTVERPFDLATELDALARQRQSQLPATVVARTTPTRTALDAARAHAEGYLARMIALQEELDWRCYQLYSLTIDELTHENASGVVEPPPLALGERAFEIVLARQITAGEEESTWFSRHGSTPITEIPEHWSAEYRALMERRIALIEIDSDIALIERPEYKRRWNLESWESLEHEALAGWLLDRLESPAYWPDVAFRTTRDLAGRAAVDSDFAQVAALWAGAEGVALESTIRRLALGAAVPFLPVLRYTESGCEKRLVWERTWELQREEDVVDARVAATMSIQHLESAEAFAMRVAAEQKRYKDAEVGPIPRPPQYKGADFQRTEFWTMRGGLDVPRERFIVYPFLEREGDDAPVLGWAGWNHLQQAQALASWYADRTQQDGWQRERVIPILAGMAELLPWLRQWHNEVDAEFGDRPGEAYASWLDGELQQHGLTRAALDAWEPPRAARRGRTRPAKRAATKTVATED